MYLQILPGCSLGAQWQHLLFPAELIYEEVIDWEERNKNGLMKEDCSGRSGRHLHYSLFFFFMLQVTVGLGPPVNSVSCESLLSLVSDVVSGSASQSSSANDISSMSTEQTLASDTDSSSIDTLTGPLDESQWSQSQSATLIGSALLHQNSNISRQLLFCPPPTCSLFSLFCVFVPLFLSPRRPSLTFKCKATRVFFSPYERPGRFLSVLFWLVCCLEVESSLSAGPLGDGLLFDLIKYIWRMHPCRLSGIQKSFLGGWGFAVWSICLYLNSFIFLVNPNL